MAENRLGEMNKNSIDSLAGLIDPNAVVGTPIETASGTTIIPITKMSVGYASGGVDYASKKDVSGKPGNFGGGGGTGLTVSPVAFIVVQPDGNVSLLNVGAPAPSGGSAPSVPADSVSQVIGFLERSPDLIERIKAIFSKKKEENKI